MSHKLLIAMEFPMKKQQDTYLEMIFEEGGI
jgi:hypothetical protein